MPWQPQPFSSNWIANFAYFFKVIKKSLQMRSFRFLPLFPSSPSPLFQVDKPPVYSSMSLSPGIVSEWLSIIGSFKYTFHLLLTTESFPSTLKHTKSIIHLSMKCSPSTQHPVSVKPSVCNSFNPCILKLLKELSSLTVYTHSPSAHHLNILKGEMKAMCTPMGSLFGLRDISK